jgi:hypothetical protein
MILANQRCLHHPAREAVARCPGCGNTFCRECVTEHDDRVLCAECLVKQSVSESSSQTRFALLARLGQLFCGLFLAWLFFYGIGQALLALPSSFHNGTVLTHGLLNEP